jgi:ribosomal protein L37AE/L43A
MEIKDTRPLKCKKCGSTAFTKRYIDRVEITTCDKCGHESITDYCIEAKRFESNIIYTAKRDRYREF